MGNRVRTLPSDLSLSNFTLGSGKHDAVFMIHTIREWSAENVKRFFRVLYEGLKPHGALIVDMLAIRREGEYPSDHSIPFEEGLYFLTSASNEQHLHHWEDVAGWLRAAGFTNPNLLKSGLLIAERY